MKPLPNAVGILLATSVLAFGQATTNSFFNWETPPVHPVALSPDGTRLVVCNLPDNRLEIFDVTSGRPVAVGSLPVGLDPVSVRFRAADEVWVANFISDSVSIVSVSGRDLHGTNLSGPFLANADLRSVNLTSANLNLAILFQANLGDANLQNANLSGVDFTDAILTNAILNSANFNSANLTRASLFGATTNGASFLGATFNQTIMPDGSVRSR